jgi:para-aminobenzoate synthetase component I
MEHMKSFIQQMNHLASEGIPFLFVIDFDQNNPFIIPLKEVDSQQIMYEIGGSGNVTTSNFTLPDDVQFELHDPSFEIYEKAFNEVT